MFRNYLTTALRNIARHKLYSFINIAGLAVGLACAVLVILFVRDQLSYDRWIPGTDNIYRLEYTILLPGKPPMQSAMISFVAAQAMLDHIPEVQARTRIMRKATTILIGNRQFPQKVIVADPNFLTMIRLPLVTGDPAAVLARPESAVLSQTAARRFFGDTPAIGKTLLVSGQRCDDAGLNCVTSQQAVTVTGILRDLPHNTQFQAEVIIPNTSAAFPVNREMRENWLWANGWSYVRLAPGADPAAVTAKFRRVIDQAVDPAKQMNLKKRGSDILATNLTPLVDAHLSSDQFHGMTAPGSWSIVYGFSAVAALILLIACFNFTNLSTARAMMRAREIGLRKMVGAKRRQLVVQFLGEALLTAAMALLFALALSEILMPLFSRMLDQPMGMDYFRDWRLLAAIAGVGVSAGLLSGIYPALVLSGFRPVTALRAGRDGSAGSGRLRTALVVLQFAVSIGLGIAAAVIFAQISFARNVDLGFRKDATVVLNIGSIPPATADSLARALRNGADIDSAALSDDIPFSGGHNHISVMAPGATSPENFVLVPAGPDYPRLYGIPLLAGRLLSEDRGADGPLPAQVRGGEPFNILINAGAARRLGYSLQAAIGKTLTLSSFLHNKVTIVGVIADTRQDGPKNVLEGTIYMYWRGFSMGDMSVRVRTGHMQQALSFIDRTWHAFAPSIAIQRHFLDEDYDKQFQADERQGRLFGVFVGLAIFIACLGLFGLAAFSTERRTREIGLRKTFGARNSDIVWMLLRQFTVPVLLANLIAWPLAWYYLNHWLEGFAARISLSPLYFLGAGAVALVIAWVTILGHALRVARANPVHALRIE